MALKTITPPATEPLTLVEAKRLLRIDGNADDDTVTSLIKQAREYCEEYQGKRYITQTLELVLDTFPAGNIEFLAWSPVQSVASIKYTDSAGAEHTIDAGDYILDNESFVNRIVLANKKSWPTAELQPVNGARICFVAGYGDAAAVPETVKQAMVLHMKLFYDELMPADQERYEKRRDSLLGMRRVIPI